MHILGQIKKFKPNVAIDMVSACIAHYKRFGKQIESITLDEALFHKWREGILERNEALERLDGLDIADEMVFRDVTVKKGSPFMSKQMDVKLKKLISSGESV